MTEPVNDDQQQQQISEDEVEFQKFRVERLKDLKPEEIERELFYARGMLLESNKKQIQDLTDKVKEQCNKFLETSVSIALVTTDGKPLKDDEQAKIRDDITKNLTTFFKKIPISEEGLEGIVALNKVNEIASIAGKAGQDRLRENLTSSQSVNRRPSDFGRRFNAPDLIPTGNAASLLDPKPTTSSSSSSSSSSSTPLSDAEKRRNEINRQLYGDNISSNNKRFRS
jgi:hypothetical protein